MYQSFFSLGRTGNQTLSRSGNNVFCNLKMASYHAKHPNSDNRLYYNHLDYQSNHPMTVRTASRRLTDLLSLSHLEGYIQTALYSRPLMLGCVSQRCPSDPKQTLAHYFRTTVPYLHGDADGAHYLLFPDKYSFQTLL